jgi:Fic family protein
MPKDRVRRDHHARPDVALPSDGLSDARPCPVPPVGDHAGYWIAENDGTASRAAMATASCPYKSTVPAVLTSLSFDLPADLAADAEDAAAELARFDAYARARLGLNNPALGPMSAILLRTESASSSQIENLTAGARQLALAEIGQSTSTNAAMVTANVRTMEAALRLADNLDEPAILAMQRELLLAQPGWAEHAGLYRTRLVWVGTSSITPRGAAHVGPQPDLIAAAMADLVAFMGREDLQVVAHAAIAHAQFETIHPFADGNGRTGRAIVQAMVRAKGLVRSTTAPISAGLLANTTGYTDALGAYRAGDARPIIERFAEASRFAAQSGTRLVDQLAGQIDEDTAALHATGLRPQAVAWRVLPQLIAHPVVNARFLTGQLGLNAVGAQRALTQLADAGVLTERSGLKRDRIWQHSGILAILDAYAAGLRRR